VSFRGSRQQGGWASNPNLTVYVFAVLFVVWVAFQVWAGLGGPPAPVQLNSMVTGAFGVAITAKSIEKHEDTKVQRDKTTVLERKVEALTDLAAQAHPDETAERNPPLDAVGGDDDADR
jgi:high-affinity Fe2+/Pb2+ permease